MPKLGGINRKKIKDSSGSRGEAAAAAAGKKQKQAKKRSSAGGTSKQQLSAAQLYERAQQALAFERYDAALESLRDACELEPDAVEYVDAAGALLAELGRGDEAVQALERAVQLSPDEGFEKYMYLGQLLEGQAGLAATQRGVEVLQQTLNKAQAAANGTNNGSSSSSSSREVAQLSKQLAAALCSLAEMMMGQADDVAAVSSDAELLLQQARAADGASPEPLQALASLRYEQGQPDEALVLLRQSMALWFKPAGGSSDEEDDEGEGMQEDGSAAAAAAAAAGQGDDCEFVIPKKPVTMSEEGGGSDDDGSWQDEDEEEEEDGDDDGLPSYEFRFECAKMLLELDERTDAAVQVLEDLLAENDTVLDVWHLLGLAYYSGGVLSEAREVCDAGLKLLAAQQLPADGEEGGGGIAAAFDDLSSAIAEAQAVQPDADGS